MTPLRNPMKRRTVLKGLGVSLALPVLERDQKTYGSDDSSVSRRMLLISNNLGVLPKPFFPEQSGTDYVLSPYLEELAQWRNEFTVFSGLSHPGVVGGHSTENCFLTAARGPTLSGFRNQISLDQFAADLLGPSTRFPTLNVGVNIDRANRSLSWTRDGALLPAEDSPAALFAALFLDGSVQERQKRVRELKIRHSILDVVGDQTQTLNRSLGRNDQRRVEQYFASVRELEKRMLQAGQWEHLPKPQAKTPPPIDIEDRSLFFEKIALMLSMACLAFETDCTRIISLMIDGFATPSLHIDEREKTVSDYHNLSHHGNVPDKLRQLESIDRRQMKLLAELLKSLAERTDEDTRLIDSTMVLYGSNMGDSNTHDNTNLPVLLAGGKFRHGRHMSFDPHNNTPLSNLFVSMLRNLGLHVDQFGSSTGAIL